MAKHIRSGVDNATIVRQLVVVSKANGSMDDLAVAVNMKPSAVRSRVQVLRKKFAEIGRELPELKDGRRDRKIDMDALAALLPDEDEGAETESE